MTFSNEDGMPTTVYPSDFFTCFYASNSERGDGSTEDTPTTIKKILEQLISDGINQATIVLVEDIKIPETLTIPASKTVILIPSGNRIIGYPGSNPFLGSLFTVDPGATLGLKKPKQSGESLTLQGIDNNNNALISVTGDTANTSVFIMEDNITLKGNTNRGNGGAVFINSYGRFTMHGGTINLNRAENGGAVYAEGTGTKDGEGNHIRGVFIIYKGTITGNSSGNNGAGVYVGQGFLGMYGGLITGNTCDTNGTGRGGGYYILDGVAGGGAGSGGTPEMRTVVKDNSPDNSYSPPGI